jgi:hypothetical protein
MLQDMTKNNWGEIPKLAHILPVRRRLIFDLI